LRPRAIYLPTLVSPMSMPSLSSSPWMRGGRGRDSGCPLPPPAQTRAGAASAHGSYLGCLASKRTWLPAHGPAHLWSVFPTRCSAQVLLVRVLLGWRPSLHSLRWRSPALVQLLRRYYATVRLPATVHVGLMAHRFLPPVRGFKAADSDGASRFSRVEFLYLPGVFDSAGPRRTCASARRLVAFRLG
jgi:hypothetical protein